jgi:hypothetical protein
MENNTEMASDGVVYISRVMMISSDIQTTLSYYVNNLRVCSVGIRVGKDFMKYAAEMAKGGMRYIPSFMMTGSGLQAILRVLITSTV